MAGDKKQCYVIMPYGKKYVGRLRFIDFESVYRNIIESSKNFIKEHEIEFSRSKDEKKTGGITEEFINSILDAEICIIDVSNGNANVFYELGLRHAFRKRISVIIAHASSRLPFDIKDMRVIFYDHRSREGILEAAKEIAAYIETALNNRDVDSPVYKMVSNYKVTVESRPCPTRLTYVYQIRGVPDKFIGVMAGDMREVRDVDVWVNSENTDMEMARMCDSSVSGLIRFFGSTRGIDGRIRQDLIQEFLWEQIERGRGVVPATVIATDPGELESCGVRKLLHVAAYQGTPGKGYEPVDDLDGCVTQSLQKVQELNKRDPKNSVLRSVLFPIFGTGQRNPNRDQVLFELVTAACRYLKHHQDSIKRIYFQAYTEEDLRLCRNVLSAHSELEDLSEVSPDVLFGSLTPDPTGTTTSNVLTSLKELKSEAKELRSKGDLVAAIEKLQKGTEEGRKALAEEGANVELAEEVADCVGMLGGNLSREGRMSEAKAAYLLGRDIEMNVPGVTLTYNTVNLMVTQLLDDGWETLRYAGPDILKVIQRLQTRMKRGGRDLWTLADLGMCQFLHEDFVAAEEAYRQAANLAENGECASMLGKIQEIEERWPENGDLRKQFYEDIRAVLSGK